MLKSNSAPELAAARQQGYVNISEAAHATGVSAKMIRHYEAIGLTPPAQRTLADYRVYSETDLHRLRFIRRARNLGFPIKQIETLLDLWNNRERASADVKRLAMARATELSERINEMQAMQRALKELAEQCHGDGRPDCPILDDLSRDLEQKH